MANHAGIEFKGLRHRFNDEDVLNDISYAFNDKTFVAILGPSGCGKTTLLKCAAGLIQPSAGAVLLSGSSPDSVRKEGQIGYAFQTPTLLPWRTALQNIVLPLELLNKGNGEIIDALGRGLLGSVDLVDDAAKYPFELSGGMQQRVSLARALVTSPSYLFLDEPFSALDGITRDRLNEMVRSSWEKDSRNIIFVTHSIEEAVFLAEWVVVLSPRPASIQAVLEITLGPHRDPSSRSTNSFFDLTKQLRNLIEEPRP